MNSIDDYLLADFMAGRLAPDERAEVIQHLATHEDAREWLRMSYQALEAAHPPAPARPSDAAPVRRAARPRVPARFARIAAVVVLLAGVGAALHVALGPAADVLRTSEAPAALELRVDASPLAIEWSTVPGAHHYEVIVWDAAAAATVASEQVDHPRLSASPAFTTQLHALLHPGRTYSVRIEAFDEQNRQLVTSRLQTFVHAD